ncbi:MAG: ATP-binding protein [Streptosporangiaceae bacterium]
MTQSRTFAIPDVGDASRTRLPDEARLTVPGRPEQVATARAFVAKALGDNPQAETAILLTSEIVTNSVLHSTSCRPGGTVTITVAELPGGGPGPLRVEVTDDGATGLPQRRKAGDDDENGHGLQLVDALATRWGCRRASTGTTTTWFELA